jgi:6-phosphogluconolactonase
MGTAVSLIKSFSLHRFVFLVLGVGLLASCGGSDNNAPSPASKVAVPNVVGLTQAAATSSITGAGLTVGTVTTASSATVASGSVVSQNPAAATQVASASAVNLTVSSGPAQVAVPNVVGMTQAAATTAITGAGLTLGTVTMASSATVASGNVISQSPAAATSVASGSAINLTVSSGGTQVAVPNVVGMTQAAATTSITGAALVVGTVTMASSTTVASGSVISQNPAAATMVSSGSAVNLTVSTGAATSFAYVANAGDGSISAYSVNSSTGALTALAGSPIALPGAGTNALAEIKVDPSGKFLYVVNDGLTGAVYAYAINASDGSLTAVAGSPFPAGVGSFSLTFDASGTHLYTANAFDNNGVGVGTISAYSLDTSTGVLTPLANSPYTIAGTDPEPTQIVRAGNFLYVTDQNNNCVEAFAIASGTGALTQNVPGSPFATDVGPFSLAVDPSGSVLYTNNGGAIPPGQFMGAGSISAFTINATTGALIPVAGNPLQISAVNGIGIDPSGKFLFLTESSFSPLVNGVSVYPINKATGVLGTLVAGSPFAAGGSNAFSVSFDPTGQFVYVGNDQSANVSAFTLNSTTGVLTPVAGSPVAAGNLPDYIAIK